MMPAKNKQTKTTDLTEKAICLAKIEKNSRLSLLKQRRFDLLRGKLHAETLTQSEETELQDLWQSVEQMNARRLEALTELSQKRGIHLRALMDELGIGAMRFSERPSPQLRREVAQRAQWRCEYCLTPHAYATQPFAADHILPQSHEHSTT